MPQVRRALEEYDIDADERERRASRISFLDEDGEFVPGRTQQNFANEVDINNIIRRYDKDGLITHVAQATAQYGDFTEVNEYQESLNRVIAAQDAFDELPSNIRLRFRNDPGFFFEFATNPDNLDEMIELGLAEPTREDPLLGAIGAVTQAIQANQSQPTGGSEA